VAVAARVFDCSTAWLYKLVDANEIRIAVRAA
jgi:hypothetical protein